MEPVSDITYCILVGNLVLFSKLYELSKSAVLLFFSEQLFLTKLQNIQMSI